MASWLPLLIAGGLASFLRLFSFGCGPLNISFSRFPCCSRCSLSHLETKVSLWGIHRRQVGDYVVSILGACLIVLMDCLYSPTSVKQLLLGITISFVSPWVSTWGQCLSRALFRGSV